MFVAELCVLRTFGGVDFSLIFICAQSVPEFLWDRLRASIQFPVMPKRAQYARFSGEDCLCTHFSYLLRKILMYNRDSEFFRIEITLDSEF